MLSVNRRIFSGVLIFILLIAGIILSAQPTPARSDDTPTARLIESDDPLVQRSGHWTNQTASGASGGSYLYSGKSVNDVLTLEFVGPRIEIIYVQNPALGALAIEVDGTVLRTVMTDGTTPQFGNHAVVDYLDNGPHTLKVYPQKGTMIGVDAFYIPAPPPATPTASVPTVPPTSTPVPRTVDNSKISDTVMAAAQANGPIRVIVQLRTPSIGFGRAEFSPRLNAQMQSDVLATVSGKFDLRYQYSHLPAVAGYADFATLVQLQANPLVESIVIDEPSSMHMGQSGPAIQADVVRNTYGLRGRGITVAVLDTGIDTNHSDLSDDIVAQHCETQVSCPPSNTASGISAEDANGHGTNVSGVVTSNGVVAPIGFAPDAKIVAVRVLDASGSGFVSDWVDGLNWIIANQSTLNVNIINMSLGTNALYANAATCNSAQPTVLTAVTSLINNGVTIFASSGNQGSSTSLASPSCNTGVIAVGATYDSDLGREPDSGTYNTLFGGSWPPCFDAATNTTTITCFTNSNAELDLLAPGAQITSSGIGGGTSTYRGTSQASPTAAGVAALMLEANPTLTPAQIQSVLYTTGVNVTDSKNGFTFRRINALAAVQYVLPDEGAGAPSNDLFAGSVVVSTLPYRRTQEVFQATVTGTDPSAGALCNVGSRSDTVWYSYFAPASQVVSITTEGSTYDTVLGVFTGTEGALTPVACNDDTDALHNIRTSALNFNATGGVTYRIMVSKFGTPSIGTSILRLSVSTTPLGDTIALFNSTSNVGSLVDSLATSPAIANYATYPTGYGTTGGQWLMGDWNGDGQKTPGVYVGGAFFFTNSIGYTGTWTSIWIGLVGRPAVAGRFSNAFTNDCIGAVDSANFPPYGIAYAMYFTCNLTSGPTPPLTFQWLSVLLPDSQGHVGTAQFTAGDWNNDGVESIAIRRTNFIAFTNTPPTTQNSAFDLAQYFGSPSAVSYGTFVSGDWDSDGVDSFGLVYSNGAFYRRNDVQWNTGQYILQNLGQPTGTISFAASWRQR